MTGVERSNGSKMRREEKTRKEKKRQEKTRRRRRNTLLNRIQKWVSVVLCVVGVLAAAAADDQSSIGNVSVQIGLCVWVTLKCVRIKCGEADKCVCLEGR